MRTTITVDDELLQEAADLTGEAKTSTLVRLGLEALVLRESTRRLARLGGTDPAASVASRRRTPE